eukprot:361808-Chlamydomonas_euryale.AAC.4
MAYGIGNSWLVNVNTPTTYDATQARKVRMRVRQLFLFSALAIRSSPHHVLTHITTCPPRPRLVSTACSLRPSSCRVFVPGLPAPRPGSFPRVQASELSCGRARPRVLPCPSKKARARLSSARLPAHELPPRRVRKRQRRPGCAARRRPQGRPSHHGGQGGGAAGWSARGGRADAHAQPAAAFLSAGALPLVLGLLTREADTELLVQSAVTLGSLSYGTPVGLQALLAESGISVLVTMLQHDDLKVVQAAIRALKLVYSQVRSHSWEVEEGGGGYVAVPCAEETCSTLNGGAWKNAPCALQM